MRISILALQTAFPHLTPEGARLLRGYLHGTLDARTHPAVEAWAESCYHDPRQNSDAYPECLMVAANAILEGYGVEAIRGRWVDRYHGNIQASYVNFGDTYDLTLLRDNENGRYQLTSWGEWVERHGTRRRVA